MEKKYLQDQGKIFEKINAAVSNSVYIFDLNENAIVWMNEKGQQAYGYSTAELRLMGPDYYQKVIHPNDVLSLKEALIKAKHLTDHDILVLEYRIRDRAGAYHWISDRVTAFSRGDDQTVSAVLGVATDIENRKNYEQNLEQTIQKLNLSLAAAKMGTWEWDLQTNTVVWDDQMYKIHDMQRDPATSPLEEMWRRAHREDLEQFNLKTHEAAEKQQDFYVTYRTTYQNQEVHHIKVYGKCSQTPNSHLMYGVAWDSTVEILTEREMTEAKARLISATKMAALGEMSGGIAHEINNPLTVIQARAFQLTQMVESQKLNPEKIKQAAESISRTADKIAKIIKSVRSFAREGTYDPFEFVSVRQIVEETLEFCRTRFYNHGVEIEVESLDEEIEIECRVIQIEQVLLNLLNNSFDAVQNLESKWIRISVKESSIEGSEYIDIIVTDSGQGIDKELAAQIMTPFFTTKDSGMGTGLGLSISRGIVQGHKGDLLIDLEAANTSFVIRLPRWQN